MAHDNPLEGKLVVLIGGSGFLGSRVAQDLLQCGVRLRIVARNPEKAFRLKPLANLGQIQMARCKVQDRRSVDLVVSGADAVVYLAGTFGPDQAAVQAEGPGFAAEAAAAEGCSAFVLVSAIGADASSDSGYAGSKGEGEQRVSQAFPAATIMRPSIIFGEDDNFINMFAELIRIAPVLPVFGPEAQVQPVWVDDVAAAIVSALASPAVHGGKIYELAGPDVITMMELNRQIAAAQGRKRHFIALPDGVSAAVAAVPGTPISTDQWRLLKQGNVASGKFGGLPELGVSAHPLSLFLDRWMTRFRKHGRFTQIKPSA